jgi:hypothetical protein
MQLGAWNARFIIQEKQAGSYWVRSFSNFELLIQFFKITLK